MCGIIGYIGENCIENLVNGLKNLEYRGYDSCGIGFFYNEKIEILKSIGKIDKLEEKINLSKYSNVTTGMGHTRWATHGKVETKNSHPFESNNVIIIHNGIIENYDQLHDFLISKGYKFKSDVDSETIAHLIDYYYKDDCISAIKEASKLLKGMYSILILFKNKPNVIYGIKNSSPLYVGHAKNKIILSSDLSGIIEHTNQYYRLNDNELIECTSDSINLYDNNLNKSDIDYKTTNLTKEMASKDGYKHFMLKEIFEEEQILKNIQNTSIDYLKPLMKSFDKIVLIGCGSAYNAGLVGKYLFTNLLNIPTKVEIANEFRYAPFLYDKKTLFIFISQSGETADTIAALRLVKAHNAITLGIVNVISSTIANECDYLISLNIGSEIAVASTKAYFSQVAYLYKLCFLIANERNIDIGNLEEEYMHFDLKIPRDVQIKALSKIISKKKNIFYLGRSNDYNLALEGSLKLKEITYIHSESYPAGELKHGPISLIDKNSLVIVIMSITRLKNKMTSNIEEILSRKAKMILISDEILDKDNIYNIKIDNQANDYLYPLSIIPILELLAYYTAVYKKTNIDKPKNLAKSVTVE